ncbi:Scr1 family TA system antitoxin-like transcriptional regulator [Nonomuraea sp. 3-1Str]|uniref:helix-turn-helix domain-containing protein n=1 Tax=Nonomuraea sp. 3-1Str TaxID=2929801 RepID=UPI0028560481|nr:Scr1 family TA system antitoxin-like transcriptional regulator [Nonomuraea sp. 3-1Str]MDR8410867.1 Scr1 family TA system antitoxin-like transcriptional regulator [Nonomuraea sp. 3-1Str]
MANIAERLDLALRERGLSGAQVAAELTEAGIPITRAYVSQLRTGKQANPTLQVLRALASCLQVSVGWLVGEESLDSGAVEDLQLRAAAIGASASGLSDGSLAVLRGVIDLARRAEGLPEHSAPVPEAPAVPAVPAARTAPPEPVRVALGERLRGLREAAGLTAEQVESALGRGAIRVEAAETGRAAPAPAMVERLLDLYGVTALPAREHVLSLARGEREPAWWDTSAVPVWLATAFALEQRASVIRVYDPRTVPPLLQTEAYARAAIGAAGPATLGQTSVEAAVRLVLARQEMVFAGHGAGQGAGHGPVVWAIMDEGVLLRSIADPPVHLAQLDSLIDLAKRPGVSLHLVPLNDPAYLPRTGPFTLWRYAEAFEPDIACAHTVERDELITEPGAVEAYHQAFAKLSVTTTTREETFDLLNTHRDRIARG